MDRAPDKLTQQAGTRAIGLWNRFADGDRSVVEALTLLFCSDFPAFCALLLKVRPKGGGRTEPFLFNQVQQRMWREICTCIANGEDMWFVLLKFRQAGMSTFWCAWIFWQIWRQRDIQTMVVAHQLATAETMIETQRVFYDELPDAFKPILREGNHGASIPRGEIYFADRRSWEMIHLSKNVDPRGQQVTHVLETEYAMYHDPDELNGALKPQLPTFGSAARKAASFIVESTPKGQNEFYDLYMDAKNGLIPGTKAVFFPWILFDEQYSAQCPVGFKLTNDEKKEQKRLSAIRMEYPVEDGGGKPVSREQMYWRRATIAADYRNNEDRFNQEYPSDDITCFLLASKSVFRSHSLVLQQMITDAKEHATEAWSKVVVDGKSIVTPGPMRVRLKPKLKMDNPQWTPIMDVAFDIHPHGHWLVWEPPASGHKYVLGADPSMGLEDGDASTICVLDVTVARQVAEFTGQLGPESFAVELAAAGYWYNQGLLVPEINNIGYVVLKRLLANITYPNMYRWPHFDEVNKYTRKRGWETNSRTKQLLVSSMINYIDEGLIAIASRELLGEMSTFEQKNEGDYMTFQAQKGRHDDLVMAFGLALMGLDQTPHLVTELNRSQSRLPSARDLHLAGTVEAPRVDLPKKMQELIHIKQNIPWNPIAQEGILY